MKEKHFGYEIARSVRELFPDAFYLKIPDMQIPPKEDGEGGKKFQMRPIKRPFDCIIYHNTYFVALELKMHKTTQAFPFSRVNDHQIESLDKIEKNGGKAGILINIRRKGHNEVFFIKISAWKHIIEYYKSRKSIPLIHISEPAFKKCDRIKLPSGNQGWDIIKVVVMS